MGQDIRESRREAAAERSGKIQTVLITVSRHGESASYDLDVPAEVEIARLAELIAQELEVLAASSMAAGHHELDVPAEKRTLQPQETLATAALWDGSVLVLRPVEQPSPYAPKLGDTEQKPPDDTPVRRWIELDIDLPPARRN